MATLGALNVDLILNSATFVRETQRVNQSINNLQREATRQTALMSQGFNAAAASVKSLAGGLAAGFSVQAIATATRATFAWADALQEASARVGVNVEQMQRLQQAGALTNVSQEAITNNLEQFSRRLGDAARGQGSFAEVLKRSGVALRDQGGALRSTSEVFDDFAARIATASSEQEALSLGVAGFGRSGADFVTTIRQMHDGLEDFGVLTADQIENLAKYDDKIAGLTQRLGFEFKRALAETIEVIEDLDVVFDRAELGLLDFIDSLAGTELRKAAEDTFGAMLDPRLLEWEKGVGEMGRTAAAAAGGVDELTDAIRRANSAAGEGLGDIEFAAAGLHVEEAKKEVEAHERALKDQASAAKRAGDEAKRLAETRRSSLSDLRIENEQQQRLLAAQQDGERAYAAMQLAIEGENAARRVGLDLSSEMGMAIATEAANVADLTLRISEKASEMERFNDIRMAAFEAMNTEEMGRRMGQASAGGMSAPGNAEAVEKELAAPFENALKSVQAEFVNTFDDISQGAISSFEDVADAAHNIFTNLASNLSTLAIFDPKGFNQLAKQQGIDPRLLGGAAAATPLLGLGVGMFGNQGARQGLQIGGGVGAAGGALIGSLVPGIGTAVGALAGGLGGSALGTIFGGLFGGGQDKGRVSGAGGALGGVSGTGQAASFARTLDSQLIQLMTVRQEQIADAALRVAPSTTVRFQEQLSEGDKSRLAAGRIGPAASALGLSAAGVAPAGSSAEEQFANLQRGIELLRSIEGIRIGPVATQFRDLNDSFDEMTATATRLGLGTAELEQQRQRETEALGRQIQVERATVAAAVGATTPLEGALQVLSAQMQEAAAQARDLGINTAGMAREFQLQGNVLIQQERIRQHGISLAVGSTTDLDAAIGNLNANMQIAINEANRLGISTANVHREFALQANILVQQDRLRRHGIMLTVGATTDLGAALGNLNAQMQIAINEANRLGISTANVHREFALQSNILIQQDRLRRHEIMVMVGAMTEFSAAIGNLNAQTQVAINEAARLGISAAGVHLEFARRVAVLTQQERIRQHGILETVGVIDEFDRALLDLHANMTIARVEAERLGFSTAGLDAEFARLAAQIERQRQAQIDELALSITSPFEQLLDPLREFIQELNLGNMNPAGQMQAAGEEFRRIAALAEAGSTVAIQQLQGAGQAFISQAERFGASPGGASARIEVQNVIESVMGSLEAAQREASATVEDVIRQASQREVDTIRELIDVGLQQIEEIKRLRR